jgi:dephospho-CoA kinase
VILGLTGSLGSGKSTVARLFEELGDAKVIDADAIAHQAQAPGAPAYADIVKAFGTEILGDDGSIDRSRLAALVFESRDKRELLNSIVHPRVRAEELRLLDAWRHHPLVVLMVPLLIENRMVHLVDKVVVVTVDEESRRQRLWERSAMPAGEVQRRLAAQMPEAEKVRHADFVIDNGGSIHRTREQVQSIIAQVSRP